MEKIVTILTNYLVEKNAIIKEDYEIYKYGLLTGLEMVICIFICFLISLKINMFGECILFFILFFSVRSFVGGVHMKKFFSCLICSCIVVTLTLLTVREFPLPKIISMLLSFGEIVVIFFMSPVENVNRPVNEEESLVFLCRIRKILIGIFLLTVLFYRFHQLFIDSCLYIGRYYRFNGFGESKK